MTDFLHCNACNSLPDQNSFRKFCMATCGHIICHRCRERGPNNQCAVCKKKCNVVEIGKLDGSMQHVFADPLTLAKKQQKQMAEALHFQKVHRTRYLQFLHQQAKKARKLQECAANEAKKRQHFERENEDLKGQVAQLKRQLMHSSTLQMPCVTPDPLQRYRPSNLNRLTNIRYRIRWGLVSIARDSASGSFNNMMTVSSARTTMSMDSGSSLPVGAEAATFRNTETSNFHHGTLPITPFLDESLSSPNIRFNSFENVNMSKDSVNTMVAGGGNSYQSIWQNNMSAMTLGANSSPQASGRQNGSFMNNVVAAFRHGP